MVKPKRLHLQFLHTLVPGFHSHLSIPLDFFSKYIEGRSVEKTAKLKSDSSDKTWKVKMTGRRFIDGWEEFAVAHDLQIGDVIIVRYEGDMMFHVSDLGPNSCEIQVPSNNSDDGEIFLKKHLHPRTDDEELPRKKKVKKNSFEIEADSSSLDNSCFVAIVKESDLCSDTLYLPQHFTSSNGLTVTCRKIVLIDGGKRSWALELRFKGSSNTFYISHGWRNFCEENSKKPGDFFMFKLVGNGETLVLSFFPTESMDNRTHSEASWRESISTEPSNKEEDIEKNKCSRKRRALSYSPCYKRFITFTLPPDYVSISRLTLPKLFLIENGINKPGEIYLLGKNGTKWLTSLLLDKRGLMRLGKGWKEFVKANGVESGFTLKLIRKDTALMLSLCCEESTSDSEQEEYFKAIKKQSSFIDPTNRDNINKDSSEASGRESLSTKLSSKEENIEEESSEEDDCSSMESLMEIAKKKLKPKSYSSYSPCHKQSVTYKLPPDYDRIGNLSLPISFVRDNGINKPGEMYFLSKDGTKWPTNLILEKSGRVKMGKGWKEFVKENGLEAGFTVKLVWENTTPVFSLGSEESASDIKEEQSSFIDPSNREEISKDENKKEESMSMEEEKNHLRGRDSTPTSQNQSRFVTITRHHTMRLPKQFVEENSLNKPGMIYLLGKDGRKWMTNLVRERDGRMNLGNGWRVFAEANDLKPGESVTLESIYEEETPMLRFHRKKESSSRIQNRFLTLKLTPEDVKACTLYLPNQFMSDNGINKLGKITLLGENKMEWSGYLLSTRDGTVALDNGWYGFCEANGVKLGEFFTLEFVYEQDTSVVLKFCSR